MELIIVQVFYELQQHSQVEDNEWKWKQINCVGPLSTRSHFQQILVQLTNSKLMNCVSSCFVDNVILALVLPNFLE